MPDDPLLSFDATDTVAENNARRDLERQAREDADVLRAVMHTRQGRAFILRQLEKCFVNSPAKFVMGDPAATAHNLGRESYGLELLQDVQRASVDLYMTGVKEQIAEEKRKQEIRRAEQKRREEAEQATSAEQMLNQLPPPPGYPGHVPAPDLRPKKK